MYKYYALADGNMIVARVSDSGDSAVFFAKRGWQDDVDAFEETVEVRKARQESAPYDEAVLKNAFSDLVEISSDLFDSAVGQINTFNQEYDNNQAQLEGMTDHDMGFFITEFPARRPRLASYEDINKLWTAMFVVSTGGGDDEGVRTPEQTRADLKALYSLLKNAENTNDGSTIRNLVRSLGDFDTGIVPDRGLVEPVQRRGNG